MVIDSDRENSLGLLLTNYVLVENLVNFFGIGSLASHPRNSIPEFLPG